MICPFCQHEVPELDDGSLAMHARDDGQLCRGTNCTFIRLSKVSFDGFTIDAHDVIIDPDRDGLEPTNAGHDNPFDDPN
jgi:hypothetical protein